MKKRIKNICIMLLVLVLAFGVCLVIDGIFNEHTLIPAIFVLAVYIVSVFTEGYAYGAAASVISVLAVNFAFTFPFFKVDFTIHENLVSALIMIAVTLLTGTLTTKIRQQDALRAESEKERMRANLLRAVSHDLRTPLTTIYGSSSTIIDNYDRLSDERKLQLLEGIKSDSEWLTRMVENLLSVTKLDGGNMKIIKSPVVAEELADSVMQKFSRKYPGIKLSLDMPEDIIIVPMDALLMEQVIINIMNNSFFHGEGMTSIHIKIYTDNGRCVFEISDDGKGIPPEKLKNLFGGYSDGAPADIKSNSGIGLSVCAAIIKAHGGEISAENIKGGGALFRFALDMEDNAVEQ